MEAAVGRVLVLPPAVVAEREPRHRRVRAVVGDGGDDREPRPALRAVDERIPVAPVRRVEELTQAVGAGGHVGRHERRPSCRRAGRDRERPLAESAKALRVEGLETGQTRRLLLKRDRERVEGAGRPLDLDHDAVSVVSDVAAELEPCRQAMDERPEADTLDDAARAVSPPLDGRCPCLHPGSLTEELGSRNRCGLSAAVVGTRADVRSMRIGDRVAQEVPLDAERTIIPPEGLEALVDALRARGYRVIGPRVEQQAIVYGELDDASELPVGWTDVQEAATYRLERRDDEARFGYAVGPHSWKQLLFPPRVRQWRAERSGDGAFEAVPEERDERPLALIGVRSCELHAIAIQDKVFLGGSYTETDYAARREDLFVVAVNCFEPGGTCFCVSMDTGPKVKEGYDIVLTEILEGEHRFLVEAGTERGREVLRELTGRGVEGDDLAAAEAAIDGAAERMGRTLEAGGLQDLLANTLEHPRWNDVASRCLTCGNCTMVCPTCFCSSVEDVAELDGSAAERHRVWDSCFSVDHAYLHGGSIRPSGRSRYRQWLTHKFGTWHDQFGTSGCVGCGRCITWCPVGIDVTEELAALRLPEEDGHGDD